MAEFLIQALNETAAMRYWRGDLIEDYDDGRCIEPPSPNSGKVIVKVPGLDRITSRSQIAEWWTRLLYSVVTSDPTTDNFRLRIQATEFNPNSGIGKLTREMVETYLSSWGATNITVADNAVEFDIRILDAIKSAGFWRGLDRTGIVFAETSYNQTSGKHRCRVNYSSTALSGDDVERFAVENGCTIISHNLETKVLIFDITRQIVRDQFEQDVRRRAEKMIVRRKFHLGEAAIQAAEAAGRMMTVSIAEYNTFWRNKLVE